MGYAPIMRLVRLVLVIAFVSACGDPSSKHLDTWAAQAPGTILSMTDVVPGPWDFLYVFGPYTSPEEIDAALGFHWEDPRASRLDMHDDAAMLLFVHNGTVVEALVQSRRSPDMTSLGRAEPYSREEARFVCRADESGWLRAELIEQ
ncbi:MAG: hypothetical protein P8N09_13780 [Planctomycetota bacterium]|nr:hypothetical protein [Planctomycetota bacterium]